MECSLHCPFECLIKYEHCIYNKQHFLRPGNNSLSGLGVCDVVRGCWLWEAPECSDWWLRQTVLLLLVGWKHEAFRVACSEWVNCANVLRLGNSNCLLTVKHCACAFDIFAKHTGYCQTVGRNACFVRKYFCSITYAVPAVLTWRSCQCVTSTWRNIRQMYNKIIFASSVVRVMKWRRMRLVCYVARIGSDKVYTDVWFLSLKERDFLGDTGVHGSIKIRWISRNWDVGVWTGSRWLRLGRVGGHLWMR